MTQEDKELLLQDLCARLPYGVKCQIDYDNEEDAECLLFPSKECRDWSKFKLNNN